MAQELPEAGYEDIRQFVDPERSAPNAWDWIALVDDSGNEVLRVSVTSDSRADWTHSAGDQTLVAEITVSGSDSDVPTPVTIDTSELYGSDSQSDPRSTDSFTAATLEADADELAVTHTIEVPQV